MTRAEYVDRVRSFLPEDVRFVHIGEDLGAMIELTDGSLMTATSSGRRLSPDGGRSWSDPEPMRNADGTLFGVGIRHLVRLSSGALAGFYRPDKPAGERYPYADWVARSDDEGKTWHSPSQIGEPFTNSVLHGRPVVTTSGRLIAPVYTLVGSTMRERGRAPYGDGLALIGHHGYEHFFTYCWVYYSDDEGATWQPNARKGFWTGGGELFITLDESHGGNYRANEPIAVEVSENTILMILRTPLGRFYQSWSADNGETWSVPEPTGLASALAPGALARVPGGDDLLIVWNQATPDEIERGYQRHRLSTAVSSDAGASWSHGRNIFSIFQQQNDRTYVEPPPPRSYRAMLHAPRLPIYDVEGTYPFLELHRDTAIIRFATTSRSYYLVDDQGRTGYDRPHNSAMQAGVCVGVPVSWFYEDLRKYG